VSHLGVFVQWFKARADRPHRIDWPLYSRALLGESLSGDAARRPGDRPKALVVASHGSPSRSIDRALPRREAAVRGAGIAMSSSVRAGSAAGDWEPQAPAR